MKQQLFLLQSGIWLGEGKICLTSSDEELKFYTRWTVPPIDSSGMLECVQDIEISGISDKMRNVFSLSEIGEKKFHIELENQTLGRIVGKGIIKENTIGWELRNLELGFEGFEFYNRESDDSYFMRAEYATSEDYRTIIQGRIWKKKEKI